MSEEEDRNRFQNQPWYIRILRRFHYWYVPIDALKLYRYHKENDMNFSECWGCAVGAAQHKMKWYYTLEELEKG